LAFGSSALAAAANSDSLECVKLFVELGADMNGQMEHRDCGMLQSNTLFQEQDILWREATFRPAFWLASGLNVQLRVVIYNFNSTYMYIECSL
jgi:hypothetical protein